jgi:hypothetical protein
LPERRCLPGWTGKMWAVSQGLQRALAWGPDFVLLTDADIEHAPDNLRALLARAERDRLDLVSFMVRLQNRTFAERFAIPAFVFFFFKLYPPARGWAPREGACWCAHRCCGGSDGVDRIRGAIIDDCALAREVRNAGGRIWMGLTARTRSLRSYGGLGEIAEMIARTAFTQLRHSVLLLVGTVRDVADLRRSAGWGVVRVLDGGGSVGTDGDCVRADAAVLRAESVVGAGTTRRGRVLHRARQSGQRCGTGADAAGCGRAACSLNFRTTIVFASMSPTRRPVTSSITTSPMKTIIEIGAAM